MIAVDTNVLVHAHRKDAPRHAEACAWLRSLAEGAVPWGLPVFCLGEFVRVVTHRRVFDPPSTLVQAVGALEALFESPGLRLLVPGPDFCTHLFETLREARATGNLVFDAQIVAVCREQAVTTILTEDGDFSRFASVRTIDLAADPSTSIG